MTKRPSSRCSKKALDAGIKVLVHEGPGIQNKNWDFELASAKGFGEAHAKLMLRQDQGSGQVRRLRRLADRAAAQCLGGCAIAWLKANRPDLQPVGDRYGVAENVDDSRKTALDLLSANPDLKGFLAFGSQGPIGAGRAIDERHLGGQVFVVGPFSPGQGAKLVHAGVLTGGYMWNPALAGEIFVTMGKMLADGQEIKAGMDIPGLGAVQPDAATKNIITDNLLELNDTTVDDLAAKGL